MFDFLKPIIDALKPIMDLATIFGDPETAKLVSRFGSHFGRLNTQ